MKKEAHPIPILPPSATETSPIWRNRYKLYALTAILILSVYSLILTGTATLKSDTDTDTDTDTLPNIDILEVEEREKFVEQMWELYAHGGRIRIPIFWRAAFEAAYEELAADGSEARTAAVSEIARMSMHDLPVLEPSRRSDANTGKDKHHQVGGRVKAKLSSMASEAL